MLVTAARVGHAGINHTATQAHVASPNAPKAPYLSRLKQCASRRAARVTVCPNKSSECKIKRHIDSSERVCQYVSQFCTSHPEVEDIVPRFVDLEKLSYKCASLVKIGANHVELLLAAHTDISPCRKWVASPVFFRLGLSQNPKPKNQTSDLGLFSGLACLVQANFCWPKETNLQALPKESVRKFCSEPQHIKAPCHAGRQLFDLCMGRL